MAKEAQRAMNIRVILGEVTSCPACRRYVLDHNTSWELLDTSGEFVFTIDSGDRTKISPVCQFNGEMLPGCVLEQLNSLPRK